MRQSLKLIKVLAGNDDCKAHIVQLDTPLLMAEAMEVHKVKYI